MTSASLGARAPNRSGLLLPRLSDRQFVALVSFVWFALAAFPLLLVEIPPLQDLPNHLATISVLRHPELYPEFTSNGFAKTNSAFFLWLYALAPKVGMGIATKVFVAGLVGLNAFVFSSRVFAHTRRRSAVVLGALFAFPLAHNWFVSAGMLDFALSVPLAFILLGLVDAQGKVETTTDQSGSLRGVLMAVVALLTWYAHSMGLLIAGLLVAFHWLVGETWRGRRGQGFRLTLLPLAPAGLLVALSILSQVRSLAMDPAMSPPRFSAVWEVLYNFWAQTFWSFTKLSILSVVPCASLVVCALFYGRAESAALRRSVFASSGLIALVAIASVCPFVYDNWFHVNTRFFLFIAFALLLRLPRSIPKWLTGALVVSALSVSVGNAVDYVRLAREQTEFDNAIPKVAEGARLLPLVFKTKEVSENTRNLIHAWGDYVVAKHTSAPLLFAHSRSFPVTYAALPPARFNHLVLESTAARLRSSKELCDLLVDRRSFVATDCRATYDQLWKEFWADAAPRFDHVLTWDASEEALANIPRAYRLVHEEGRTRLYVRAEP